MLTEVPHLMIVDYCSTFPPKCDSVMKDDSALSTVGHDGSEYSVSENTILTESEDASITKSYYVYLLDSGFWIF